MSKIKPERAYACEHFKSFAGLGSSPFSNSQKASDIQNFRICSDGSLRKRKGYRPYRSFDDTIRAYWEGAVNSTYRVFAVCGKIIYSVDFFSGTVSQAGSVVSASDRLNFIMYEDNLYLPDIGRLLVYEESSSTFEPVTAYVPLYGKKWDPLAGGDMNEPINLLTNHVRVHYTNSSNSTTFALPFYAKSIDTVLVNGSAIDSYTFVSGEKTLSIPSNASGVDVEIGMEIYLEEDPVGIHSAVRGLVYSGQHRESLCLYGSMKAYRIYCSTPVSQSAMSDCAKLYPTCKSVYFQNDGILLAGTSQNPLNAVCQYGSMLLAYSKDTTWRIDFSELENELPTITPLLSNMGCSSGDGAIICNGYPIVVNDSGVFQICFSSSDRTPPETVKLSDDVCEYLTADMLRECLVREEILYHELWIHNPNDAQKRIFVYNFDHKKWYLFTEFSIDLFVSFHNFHGFVSKNTLYRLDETQTTDAGNLINAVYQSGYFSFSHPEAKKRSLRMVACVDTFITTPTITLESESASRDFSLVGHQSDTPEIFDCRSTLGRFRFLRFRFSSSSSTDCRLYSLSFYANL